MSEALAAFQAQLSGLMETVFKAAMYEIVRLVEDSFVEEVSRSREQVEALRKRLQWAEGRRREAERCAQCGKAAVWGPEHGGPEGGRGLKQEGGAEGRWSSCPKGEVEEEKEQEEEGGPAAAKGPEEASGPGALHAPEQPALVEGEKPVPLKREQVPPRSSQEPQRWSVSADGEEADVSAPDGAFGEEMQPPSVDGWASSASLEGRGSLRGHVAESTEQYRTRFSQEGLVGLEDALETEPKAPFVCQVFDGEALRGHGLEEPQSVQLHYDAPGLLHTELGAVDDQAVTHLSFQRNRVTAFGERFRSRSASPRGDVDIGELSYLLINEDGYLQETDDSYWGQPGVESVSGEGQSGQRVRGEEFVSLHRDADGRSESLDISSPGHCGERARSCSQCHVSFADLGALKVHMSSHRAPSTYTCTQCGKSFTQACNLKVHQRIHSREGLHLCSHCGKGFVSFADLKKHKCSHTGDKPYCCMLCGNKFSRLWNLKLHRRIHTQEKPHRCTQCEKSFTRADILKVHQRTHTGERPYCCTMCGLSFKRLDHLKSHQRKHRPQQS